MKKTAIALLTLAAALLAAGCQKENITEKKDNVLKGEFSVSETKKVHFSRGNLIATIDENGAPTAWGFATNQYDSYYQDDRNIGKAAGVINFFGWSTDATTYGICTSRSNGDYYGEFKDWGTAIDDKGTWRTLSAEEWKYLLSTRSVNGGTKEGKSYQRATIHAGTRPGGVYGLILYPDNYTAQITEFFYTNEQWVTMENAGCVFLPAAGNRLGPETLGYIGERGYYWSSSPGSVSSSKASSLFFLGNGATAIDNPVRPNYFFDRYHGLSVRLVTDVN